MNWQIFDCPHKYVCHPTGPFRKPFIVQNWKWNTLKVQILENTLSRIHSSKWIPVKSSHSRPIIITTTGSNLNKCIVIESVWHTYITVSTLWKPLQAGHFLHPPSIKVRNRPHSSTVKHSCVCKCQRECVFTPSQDQDDSFHILQCDRMKHHKISPHFSIFCRKQSGVCVCKHKGIVGGWRSRAASSFEVTRVVCGC